MMMALGLGSVVAQQRFKAGLIAGVTASQIDGDLSAGYHKVGLQGGLRGIAVLKEKQEASVEILYTQRGCRQQPKDFRLFNITLNYIEVPVQWHYKDWLVGTDSDDPDFYRINVNAGLMYSRLLDYTDKYPGESIGGIDGALPDLNRNSFGWTLGATFFATRHLGLNFRMHRFFNKLYQPGKSGTNYASYLKEHYLAFQLLYIF